MTYNEQKVLYESIMKQIAKKVKAMLNEAYGSNMGELIRNKIISISKANPDYRVIIDLEHFPYSYISYCNNGTFSESGGLGAIRLICQLTDECFDGKIVYNNNIDVESLPNYYSKVNKKKYDDLLDKYTWDYNKKNKVIDERNERFQYITVWLDNKNLDKPICVLFTKLKNYNKIDELAKELSVKVGNREHQKFNDKLEDSKKQQKREDTLRMLKKKNQAKTALDNITLP